MMVALVAEAIRYYIIAHPGMSNQKERCRRMHVIRPDFLSYHHQITRFEKKFYAAGNGKQCLSRHGP